MEEGAPAEPAEEDPPPPPQPRVTGLAGAESTDLAAWVHEEETTQLAKKGDFWQRRSSAASVKRRSVRMSLSAQRRASRPGGLALDLGDMPMADKAGVMRMGAVRRVAEETVADALKAALASVGKR